MAYNVQVAIDTLRSVAFGSITASYAVLGTAFTHPIRIFCLTNTTDKDMLISTDGSNDKLIVAADSYKLYDLNANCDQGSQEEYKFVKNTQFYVKYVAAPSRGAVYLEAFYGIGE